MQRQILTKDSWLDIGSITVENGEFEKIWKLCPLERGKVMVYGEKITPRFQQSYIRDYTFSGVESKALPLPSELEKYLILTNSLGYGSFNQVLMNYYSDGSQYIGSHADSTQQLIPFSPIVTLSLGGERTFRIRSKEDKKIVKDITTKNGLILVMGGKFQQELRHEIVKIAGSKGEKTPARISITFRQFI